MKEDKEDKEKKRLLKIVNSKNVNYGKIAIYIMFVLIIVYFAVNIIPAIMNH